MLMSTTVDAVGDRIEPRPSRERDYFSSAGNAPGGRDTCPW